MTDKSIKELALSVERSVEKLLEQVRDAGYHSVVPTISLLLNSKIPLSAI
jgi:hypothetical protein